MARVFTTGVKAGHDAAHLFFYVALTLRSVDFLDGGSVSLDVARPWSIVANRPRLRVSAEESKPGLSTSHYTRI